MSNFAEILETIIMSTRGSMSKDKSKLESGKQETL